MALIHVKQDTEGHHSFFHFTFPLFPKMFLFVVHVFSFSPLIWRKVGDIVYSHLKDRFFVTYILWVLSKNSLVEANQFNTQNV